ncbi:hypothetical protein TNCV_1368771 [Trichonephila clavipes]|nr:hypothetical protein TNCV_1368771 [Trichonephila clavipes]
MERESPIPWLSKPLDVTPLDFLLEKVKNVAYQSSDRDPDELKSQIAVDIQMVDFTMLDRMWLEISY